MLRENKRKIDKAIRELDRERSSMQHQEKKLIVDMKKLAKNNQAGSCKVLAKSLIRTRHQIEKFYSLRSQLQAVSLKMQTLKSTQAMADAMKGVTKALGAMNGQLNLPALTNVMREFERQNERMEMTSEIMGDAVDDAFEEEGEEEETEELVAQVMDEIGIDLNEGLVTAPAKAMPAQAEAVAPEPVLEGADGIDSDLQARLKNLRG